MSERRRNLFVLLLVLGLIGRVDRRHRHQGDEARPRPPGRRLARLPGQADQAAADDHAGVARPRGRHHPRARRLPRRRRAVDQPLRRATRSRSTSGRRGRRARRRPGRHHRPDVLLRLGEEPPRRRLPDEPGHAVHGANGTSQITGLYNAVEQASKCDAVREPEHDRRPPRSASTASPRPASRSTAGCRRPTRRTCGRSEPGGEKPEGAEAIKVPEGILIVRAERPTEHDGSPGRSPTPGG